jgi:tetratricopeptide (TPR) repeat protein
MGLALALVLGPGVWGDVLKLKDGTTMEGAIVSETDTEIVLEKAYGGGSITSRDTILKSTVAEVIRATPAEKARQAMEQAYEATKRYKLDSQKSFKKEYYEQVIEGSLRKFIVDYSDSPYAKEVAEKIGEWEAERDKVVGGQAKVGGRWMSEDEAKDLLAQEQAQTLVQQARTLMAAQRYADAAQRLEQAVAGDSLSATAAVAKRTQKDCYQSWYRWLGEQQKLLETEIPLLEKRIEETKKKLAAAQSKTSSGSGFSKGTGSGGTTRMGGATSGTAQALSEMAAARSELVNLEARLSQMQAQLAEIKRVTPLVQAKASEAGVSLASATATATNAPPDSAATTTAATEPAGEEDLLSSISAYAKKYWMWAAGFLVVVIWFVTKRLGQ